MLLQHVMLFMYVDDEKNWTYPRAIQDQDDIHMWAVVKSMDQYPRTRSQPLTPRFAPGLPPGDRVLPSEQALRFHAGAARAGEAGYPRLPPGPRLAAAKA